MSNELELKRELEVTIKLTPCEVAGWLVKECECSGLEEFFRCFVEALESKHYWTEDAVYDLGQLALSEEVRDVLSALGRKSNLAGS